MYVGKTTLMRVVISQILLNNPLIDEPIIVWAFGRAEDLRPLLRVNKNIIVEKFDGKGIKANILEPPPSVSNNEWSNVIANTITQTLDQTVASEGFIIKSLNHLLEKYDPTGHLPSLFDLYNYIKNLKSPSFSRETRYQEGVLNRLEGSFIETSLAPFFVCSRGHSKYLINQHTIFETPLLTNHQQRLIVNYFLNYLFYYKLFNEASFKTI